MTKTELIEWFGSASRLAQMAGVTKQAVSNWKEIIPLERAFYIERATGGELTAADIRPDVLKVSYEKRTPKHG